MIIACVWQLRVGKIRLFLLDTNLPENPEVIRNITSRLSDSHHETRIAQEILLGDERSHENGYYGFFQSSYGKGIFEKILHSGIQKF